MGGDERQEIDAIGRHWDEIVRGRMPPPNPIEPSLADTIDRVRALDAGEVDPSPDAAFVRSLEETLMHVRLDVSTVSVPGRGHTPSGGVGPPRPWPATVDTPLPRPRRVPVAQLLSAAVVLLTFGAVAFAHRLPPPDGGTGISLPASQSDRPREEPEIPPAEACRVEPGRVDRLRSTGPAEVPSAFPRAGSEPSVGRLTTARLDDLPTGRPADDRTVAAITATIREMTACFNARDLARHSALFTDDHWRRANLAGASLMIDLPVDHGFRFPPPITVERELQDALPVLLDPLVLTDGRVGVLAIPRRAAEGEEIGLGTPLYFVLTQSGDRWAIDETVEIGDAFSLLIETVDDQKPAAADGAPFEDADPAPDAGFAPGGVETGTETPLLVVVHNREPEPLAFAIESLGVRLTVDPGDFGRVVIRPPAGLHPFTGSLGGRPPSGLRGSILIHPAGTPTPATPTSGSPASLPIRTFDLGFAPPEIAIPADTEILLTIVSEGSIRHTFTIDALGIDVPIEPGDTRSVALRAPAGEYEFFSRLAGHRAAGMVGTLVVGDGPRATPIVSPE